MPQKRCALAALSSLACPQTGLLQSLPWISPQPCHHPLHIKPAHLDPPHSPVTNLPVQDSTTDPNTEQAEDSTLNVEAVPTEAAVAQGGVRGEVGVDGVGYWQVTWLYLTSLLKLGEVYEVAGSHEDALHAFREGQELVRTSQLSL